MGDFKIPEKRNKVRFVPGVQESMFKILENDKSYLDLKTTELTESLVCFNNQELQSVRYIIDLKTKKECRNEKENCI